MSALPNKLSALLRIAVEDAKKCEALPNVYELEMGMWHAAPAYDGERCAVCMAGAVMAQTLKIPPDVTSNPSSTDETNALLAINSMREGLFIKAAENLEIERGLTPEQWEALEDIHLLTWSDELGRSDWDEYLGKANELEAIGL